MNYAHPSVRQFVSNGTDLSNGVKVFQSANPFNKVKEEYSRGGIFMYVYANDVASWMLNDRYA